MRECVLKLLENSYDALDIMSINDALGLKTANELEELQNILKELENEFILYCTKKNKYILYANCSNFKIGPISINKKGFGFLLLKEEKDIHISADSLGYALDGDIVLVELIGGKREYPDGKVLKVLKRNLKNIVGMIKNENGINHFIPNKEVNISLKIDEDSLNNCVDGEIVVVSLTDDLGKNKYIGNVVQHICHKDDPSQDILEVAAGFDIYPEFPEEAIKQAEELPNEVLDSDYKGRTDLCDKIIFTIDGIDTNDIDDAIGLEREDNDYILRVCIADVSYYVEQGSPLDEEALTRGTSSYLAGRVIPMLPHKLSNGICSLNPCEKRCAMTCEMKINSRGKVIASSIYPSIIKSAKKMNYTSVNRIIMEDIIDEDYKEFASILKDMNELAHIIREDRSNRGASDFDIAEPKIITDEDGHAIDIVIYDRGDAERMIEDFMVIANETVASTLEKMSLPSIYRIHDTPKPEKVQEFISFCSATGQKIKGKYTSMNPKMFQNLLSQIKVEGRAASIYRSLAVRSMPKAIYSDTNIGHFGLASRSYSHFTSPIRRYPDLQLHRLIRTYLFEGKMDAHTIDYWAHHLGAIAEKSSEREVAAVEAEREVNKMKMAEYMEQHIGEEYKGIIVDVIGFGMFIQLENLVEGLVSVSTLKDDHYEAVPELHCLIGKSTKKRYSIGDELNVKCVAASKETRMIDFEIITHQGEA